MQTLTCNTPGDFIYNHVDKPIFKPGHSILKIKYVGICGTDYHAFDGTQPFFSYPRILGHEIAALIEETGSDSAFSLGQMVTISPYYYCGTCIACRRGKTNCCTQMKVCGVHVDGAMQEYFLVPDTAIVDGNGLSAEELVLVEPLAIGAHGVSRAKVEEGEYVLVIGAGPIGLGTINFAKIAGANVIALDVNEQRLQFCSEKLGIDYTINALKEDVMERLKEITNGDMPTVVIDCTGNLKAINGAVQYMAHGARFVLIGLQKEALVISHPEFHKREGTLMSSRNAVPADFKFVIECIKNGLVKPENYITHRIKFDQLKEEFTSLTQPENAVIKAIVEF
ncbi:MAG: zinc-binding alcohol dehydrogenase family protein [Pedobacter sp.]|nr:MAG: zinc-binding alcohol dehydrogenase family protein [Pedobacter sp.]